MPSDFTDQFKSTVARFDSLGPGKKADYHRSTRPRLDNPSGMFCRACREAGMWHCAHPDECGGMEPMEAPDAE